MNTQSKTYFYSIAEHIIKISFSAGGRNTIGLLPSLAPFQIEAPQSNPLFSLTIDDRLTPIPKNQRERIRNFDTGNGETVVDELTDGGYQFIIRNIDGHDCCLLVCNKDFSDCRCALNGHANMRLFGLNNALMLVYAFATSPYDTLLIHASLVRHNGYGYAFIAKSGTGKSTQVSMWLRHIPGCDLMNDDNPIVRVIDGEPFIYGSPWSGKTPCYRNVKAKLGAVTRIDRAEANSIERLSPIDAFASFLPSCSSMKWDVAIFRHACDAATKIIETTPVYTLHCLPNKEAAEVCFNAIHRA